MSDLTSQFKKRGTTTGHAVVPTAAEQVQAVLSKWFKALQLTQMDARSLRDAGISPAAAAYESGKPFWQRVGHLR